MISAWIGWRKQGSKNYLVTTVCPKNIHFLPMVVDVKNLIFIIKKKKYLFTFIYVGRFIPLKQIEYMLEEQLYGLRI